jgi:hypothetical protein
MALHPTLATIADMYRLDRPGGPASPGFRAYHARVVATPGLVHYRYAHAPH